MEELFLHVRADGVTHMKHFLSSSTIATGLVVAAEIDMYRDSILTFLNGKLLVEPVEPSDAQPTKVIRWQSLTPRVKDILEHPVLQQWLVKQDDDVIRSGLCERIPFHLFVPMKTLQITGIELTDVHACSDFEEGLRELIEPLTQRLFIHKSGWIKQLTVFLQQKKVEPKTPSELPLVYEIEDVPEIICDVLESFGLIDVKDYSTFPLRPRLLASLLDGSLLHFLKGHKPILI